MDKVYSQLADAGLQVDGSLEFSKLVRCRVDGDKGSKRSGWYVLHELRLDSGETVVVGRYGNWKRYGDESLKVEFDRPSLTKAELSRIDAEQARLREQAKAEREARAKEAASRALRIWSKLPTAGKSAYLERKRVGAFGIAFSRGSIVVPVYTDSGLVGLQFIDATGDKKFLTGTPKQGACHLIDNPSHDQGNRIWIAEGYASGATVHMATGQRVAVAFDAGNLGAVARNLRQAFPDVEIVIAADNDLFTTDPKTGAPWNPGVEFAQAAAAAVGGKVAIPDLSGCDGQLTDFNDLLVATDLKTVRRQLKAALKAKPPAPSEPETSLPEEAPLAPSDYEDVLTIDKCLQRFVLALPDGKIWDEHKKQLLKKMAARDFMGRKLFEEWMEHKNRRAIDQRLVQSAASAAAAKGGGGLTGALKRYTFIYPSTDAWDHEKRVRVPLNVLKAAGAAWYDDWIKSVYRQDIDADRIVFDPRQVSDPKTHINTFRGLPLAPVRDDIKCQAIRELLFHLCNDDGAVVSWLETWLAYPLRHVGTKMGSAILMHGSVHGTGKSLFFEEVIKPMYGEYGATLEQNQLESQYTDYRAGLMFALFEEVLSRGQKYSHTGTLKHMVTGKTQRIEKKFMSGWEEANYMNAVFLSNETQPLPVEPSDRRFLVVWPRRKLDEDLKARVLAEIANGGLQAYYAYLIDLDLSGFNNGSHTEPPVTDAKERLIDFGRPAWEVFYLEWRNDYLDIPFMPCLVEQIFGEFRRWCDRRRENVMGQNKFSGFLAAQEDLMRRRDLHYQPSGQGKRKGVFLIPRAPEERFQPEKGEPQGEWLGRMVDKFEALVRLRADEMP